MSASMTVAEVDAFMAYCYAAGSPSEIQTRMGQHFEAFMAGLRA